MSYDLRRAIKELSVSSNEMICLTQSIDPDTEFTGLYSRLIEKAKRLNQEPPALLCTNVKGFPDKSLLIGVNSKGRLAGLLGCEAKDLGSRLLAALRHPIEPVVREKMLWEQVCYADEEGFDIRSILPAPKNTPVDAGPFITMGMCCASDPETGDRDVTIHRICLQTKDEMTISLAPGRHIGMFLEKAEAMQKPLPISISIGYDPIIAMASCFQAPVTPLGFNELSVAGGLRGEPVELARCLTIPEMAIAGSELVIEGEILPGVRMREDYHTNTGIAMPEFTGYQGAAEPALPVIKIKAVTYRNHPIIQSCIGSSFEHAALAGPPLEASILKAEEEALPGKVRNVCAPSFGGGKFAVVLQIHKDSSKDEGIQRQAALVAFATSKELKHVFLVDEDVDNCSLEDVMWAMTTRFQGDLDAIMVPGVRMHHIDPSTWPEYHMLHRERGEGCKMIFDCTVPFSQKERFQRADFAQVRMENYEFQPYEEINHSE